MMMISWIFLVIGLHAQPAYNQCLKDQQSLLLAFKNDLVYDPSSQIAKWNPSVDCCDWGGITCDKEGHVTGLDLSSQNVYGSINDSSSLFGLEFLQSLNLAYNDFDSLLGFSKLTQRLTYLNLSNAYSEGQLPVDFSLITSLVTLDLSLAARNVYMVYLDHLENLVQNLTELRHLYLDYINILAHNNWAGVISSSLPNLQVLSLTSCGLRGSLDSSLGNLKHLSVILLDGNNFSSGIPESLADLQNLTVLSLPGCDLTGLLPSKIFQVPTLKTIDLSGNEMLQGALPDSVGALELENLDLSGCGFSGPIPDSMQTLTSLRYLDLSANRFTGPIPSFQLSKNHLVWVNFYQNNLTGGIPSSHWEGFDTLEYLNLASNYLTGRFPESFLTLKSLRELHLSNNSFSGNINDPSNVSSYYKLNTMDLSSNKFEGPIPGFIFKLAALSTLKLSSNKFTGRVDLHMFGRLKELQALDLSYNNLTVSVDRSESASASLSQISTLKLASCYMQHFPDLNLDLSYNQLSGEIPNWIWEVGNGFLRSLNLSHNRFSSLQKPYTFPFLLDVLDLHSNHLDGEIPIPPRRVYILDYSSNNFRSSIPVDFGNVLTSTFFFSVSNNNLVGPIPQSICNASSLVVLDLSNNSLNGSLPSCLATKTLKVLNLRGNNFTGNVLDVFTESCGLQTLDLSTNHLQGPLPQSLVKCKDLTVLDLGHNMITDNFPCWLNNLSNLHVFVIRSNRFHGNITCLGLGSNSIQIIDIASNRFSGVLPPTLFTSFKGIIDETRSNLGYLYFKHPLNSAIYYQDSVSVVVKGTNRELEKILNIFTSVDFSNNGFQGSIPVTVGDLKLLKLVNLSHNALSGPVPVPIRKLTNLESLDLSVNKLSGSIPPQLSSLSFLSTLNLSYNELSGRIPRGSQFDTFSDSSFMGNQGLCGMPLNKSCNVNATGEFPRETDEDGSDLYVSIGIGFVVGFVMIVGPLVLLRRWRTWCSNHVDGLVSRIVKTKDERTGLR
ncbi:putative leucine-rich repeat-containing, plant-type, leucine-rich repeat domain superfamily [Helianthus annuus]|nr:receptor-like protein 30 [Helianthus annuus]KAJ0513173.1 putative leucine-rich repeat-containing, plant-type, leucine-rich repeat domain superfamily [Helianthus annuus]KAJ0520930.1 putative leucine-rich repeat-containing, plant-type, leucine-rich repeat domain superfamily [Helianthus annuus]KAJ0529297.1 putative leucine-rich repeat-containing, plant-type, leucine-rich repeat domain superfamily [Helianthus annuus]KAJ0696179.1 putative leucine-rich repeat-containing, plant-type, leucine-rich r